MNSPQSNADRADLYPPIAFDPEDRHQAWPMPQPAEVEMPAPTLWERFKLWAIGGEAV